jgi:hypothetical protein
MTTAKVIDELIYRSYSYNRQRSPEITPEQWGIIFAHVVEMEKRFQECKNVPHTER